MMMRKRASVTMPKVMVISRICAIVACGTVLPICAGAKGKPVTVRDGIRMTSLANWRCGFTASFSPNGKKFVVVLRRGDLKRNLNEYTMVLWKTDSLNANHMHVILKMSSSSFLPAIDPSSIAWSADGRSLTFLGEHQGERHEVFRLNMRTGAIRALTHSLTSVLAYSTDVSSSVLAYEALPRRRSLWDKLTAERGLVVTTQHPADLISGIDGSYSGVNQHRRLFVRDKFGLREIRPMPGSAFAADALERNWNNIAVSPNGHYLVTTERMPFQDIPESWRKYGGYARIAFKIMGRQKKAGISDISRYILVDLRTGRSRVLLNAPIFGVPTNRVIWSPDSRSVILSESRLPIGERKSFRGQLRRGGQSESPKDTVEVNVNTGQITPVGANCHQAVAWTHGELVCNASPDSIELRTKQYAEQTYFKKSSLVRAFTCPRPERARFQKRGGKWRPMDRPVQQKIDVFLRQGLNSPPELYYRMRRQKKAKLLLALNPQFRRLQLAKERMVTWNWSKHQPVTGGLYYPLNYQAGKRYPLVIQTHGFHPGRFEFFGVLPTANAAQPLAAHGMFVLQLDDMRLTGKTGWQLYEVKAAANIYKSAIEFLDKKGLIDPRRVGIIGFSRTCLYVKWVLAHDPGLFAAASVTQGVDDGYVQYLLGSKDYDVTGLYGGGPFGRHLKEWTRLSPSFNLVRVRTPLLITVPDNTLVLWDWEWFEGLRDLGKPVYMFMFDGRTRDTHLLQIPRDRFLSSEENVNWFDFWLNHRRDSNAVNPQQYRRWGRLCKMEKREHEDVRAFCM